MSGSEAERQAVNVIPPTQSATPGTGVTILAATTTAANATIPSALFHRYVDFIAEGDKIWVGFGDADAPAVDKSAAGGATFTAGTAAANGEPIPDGGRISVRLDPQLHAKLSFQSNAGNAKLIVRPSSQTRGHAR